MRRQANGDIRLEIHDDEDLCQDFLGSQSDIEDSEDMNLLDDDDTEYASQPLVQSKCKAKVNSNPLILHLCNNPLHLRYYCTQNYVIWDSVFGRWAYFDFSQFVKTALKLE